MSPYSMRWSVPFALMALVAFPAASEALRRPHVYVNSGVGLSPTPQEYDDKVQLPQVAFTVSGGAALEVADRISAILDIGYSRFGPGESTSAWISIADPQFGPSHIVTAMLGVRFDRTRKSNLTAFLTGSIGMGRVAVGDLTIHYLDGTVRGVPGDLETAPAAGVSMGFRAGSSSTRLQASFSIRLVTLLTRPQASNVVPIVVGLEF